MRHPEYHPAYRIGIGIVVVAILYYCWFYVVCFLVICGAYWLYEQHQKNGR